MDKIIIIEDNKPTNKSIVIQYDVFKILFSDIHINFTENTSKLNIRDIFYGFKSDISNQLWNTLHKLLVDLDYDDPNGNIYDIPNFVTNKTYSSIDTIINIFFKNKIPAEIQDDKLKLVFNNIMFYHYIYKLLPEK